MKVLSIGRDSGCNIVVNDEKSIISRRHAMLYIYPSGKMTLVDQGQNGTYVNGIRITPNVPYPVTRKDVVSFAHIRQLDWNLVPNSFALLRNIVVGIVAVALIVAGVYWFLNRTPDSDPAGKPLSVPPAMEAPKDTTNMQKQGASTSGKDSDATLPKGLLPSKEKKKKAEKEKAEKEKKEREQAEKQKADSLKKEKEKKRETIIM